MQITLDSILDVRPFSGGDDDAVQVGPLTVLPWESERTDVHGPGCVAYNWPTLDRCRVSIDCHCGAKRVASWEADDITTAQFMAVYLLTCHARTVCAVCHAPKPADDFPRCSACAF